MGEPEIVARYRAPGEDFRMVVEVTRREEDLRYRYRRLFDGEVVLERTITPEEAGSILASLMKRGWQSEIPEPPEPPRVFHREQRCAFHGTNWKRFCAFCEVMRPR